MGIMARIWDSIDEAEAKDRALALNQLQASTGGLELSTGKLGTANPSGPTMTLQQANPAEYARRQDEQRTSSLSAFHQMAETDPWLKVWAEERPNEIMDSAGYLNWYHHGANPEQLRAELKGEVAHQTVTLEGGGTADLAIWSEEGINRTGNLGKGTAKGSYVAIPVSAGGGHVGDWWQHIGVETFNGVEYNVYGAKGTQHKGLIRGDVGRFLSKGLGYIPGIGNQAAAALSGTEGGRISQEVSRHVYGKNLKTAQHIGSFLGGWGLGAVGGLISGATSAAVGTASAAALSAGIAGGGASNMGQDFDWADAGLAIAGQTLLQPYLPSGSALTNMGVTAAYQSGLSALQGRSLQDSLESGLWGATSVAVGSTPTAALRTLVDDDYGLDAFAQQLGEQYGSDSKSFFGATGALWPEKGAAYNWRAWATSPNGAGSWRDKWKRHPIVGQRPTRGMVEMYRDLRGVRDAF